MLARVRKLSFATIVILCFLLGIVTGLFFGELVAWMGVIGDAFIKLLQMTIIPYIVVSLITSLGSLSYEQAKSLGIEIGKFMLLLWGLGLAAMYSVTWMFPEWESASFFSNALLEADQDVNLIDLYIPSNPFQSLSQSYIPAIVVFCIATGIALIGVKEKKALMEQAHTLSEAFIKVTQFVVKLMPLGIFAMTAATAGTMDLAQFERLQVYFAAHIVMTLLLAYWLLPAVVAVITPFRFRDIAGIARDAMITAFAAGNIFLVLPILIERTKELYRKYDLADENTERMPDIIIPVVFSFPNLGKLLTIVFILFAAWFAGSDVDLATYVGVAINGLISLFGSVFLTVPMLLDELELPADLMQLFVVSSLFSSRFTSLLAAMHVFIIAVGGTAILTGNAKVSMRRLFTYALLTPVVFGITLLGTGMLLSKIVDTEYVLDEVVENMQAAEEQPPEVTKHLSAQADQALAPRSLLKIIESGVLRVGYNPNQVPFSYFNANGDLVGFDIELVQDLAADLGVDLEFIPYRIGSGGGAMLNRGDFDIAVSGLQITAKRLTKLRFTRSILDLHYSLVVKDHRAEDFQTEDNIRKAGPLKVAAVGDYSIIPLLEGKFPNVEIVQIGSDQEFFTARKGEFDGLLISLEAGKTWTMLYPEYATVFRRTEIKSFPASWALAHNNLDLLTYLNSWLELRQAMGTIDRLYDYWIQGENATPAKARWSVIKDVLHWVD